MATFLTEREEQEIRETCALFDTDKKGMLSREDIAKVVRSTGCNPTEQELLDMFQSIDEDGMEGEGRVDIDEFIRYFTTKLYDPLKNEELEANDAFRAFDPKNEGTVELHEVKRIMTNIGEDAFSDVEFRQQILKEIFIDGEGKLKYTDFTKLMNENG